MGIRSSSRLLRGVSLSIGWLLGPRIYPDDRVFFFENFNHSISERAILGNCPLLAHWPISRESNISEKDRRAALFMRAEHFKAGGKAAVRNS